MPRTTYREDYYFTLGIRDTATFDEIKAVYRDLMKKFHPDSDRGNFMANERSKRINEAYEVLSDPAKRTKYDSWLQSQAPSACPNPDVNTGAQRGTRNREEPPGPGVNDAEGVTTGEAQLREGSEILRQWFYTQNVLRQWLVPKDFFARAWLKSKESFSTLRTTREYLELTVSFNTREFKMDEWARSESTFASSMDHQDYVPEAFVEETVLMLESAEQVNCQACQGRGFRQCPPTEACSPTQTCGNCGGSGNISSSCSRCGGSGQTASQGACFACRGRGGQQKRCERCGGQGIRTCSQCNGRGTRTCRRCGGSGRLNCSNCAQHGRLVMAQFRVHQFQPRATESFKSQQSGAEDYAGGLLRELQNKNFSGLEGIVLEDQEQETDCPDVVRQRIRVEKFQTQSYEFDCRDWQLMVNRITGINQSGRVCSPGGLPMSMAKLAVAFSVPVILLAIFITLLSL